MKPGPGNRGIEGASTGKPVGHGVRKAMMNEVGVGSIAGVAESAPEVDGTVLKPEGMDHPVVFALRAWIREANR
jgi:hypothetical protein